MNIKKEKKKTVLRERRYKRLRKRHATIHTRVSCCDLVPLVTVCGNCLYFNSLFPISITFLIWSNQSQYHFGLPLRSPPSLFLSLSVSLSLSPFIRLASRSTSFFFLQLLNPILPRFNPSVNFFARLFPLPDRDTTPLRRLTPLAFFVLSLGFPPSNDDIVLPHLSRAAFAASNLASITGPPGATKPQEPLQITD